MNSLKPGVELDNLTPQMCVAYVVVASVFREELKSDCIITSGSDGKHTTIVHYVGNALDFRVSHLTPGDQDRVEGLCQAALGGGRSQFDVVFKDYEDGPCLHVEFDPR